jgi:hypothetical protein
MRLQFQWATGVVLRPKSLRVETSPVQYMRPSSASQLQGACCPACLLPDGGGRERSTSLRAPDEIDTEFWRTCALNLASTLPARRGSPEHQIQLAVYKSIRSRSWRDPTTPVRTNTLLQPRSRLSSSSQTIDNVRWDPHG